MEKIARTFELTEKQYKKFLKWYKKQPKHDYGAIGGGYSFIFTPTGLGHIIKARTDDGNEIDLTEIDKW